MLAGGVTTGHQDGAEILTPNVAQECGAGNPRFLRHGTRGSACESARPFPHFEPSNWGHGASCRGPLPPGDPACQVGNLSVGTGAHGIPRLHLRPAAMGVLRLTGPEHATPEKGPVPSCICMLLCCRHKGYSLRSGCWLLSCSQCLRKLAMRVVRRPMWPHGQPFDSPPAPCITACSCPVASAYLDGQDRSTFLRHIWRKNLGSGHPPGFTGQHLHSVRSRRSLRAGRLLLCHLMLALCSLYCTDASPASEKKERSRSLQGFTEVRLSIFHFSSLAPWKALLYSVARAGCY